MYTIAIPAPAVQYKLYTALGCTLPPVVPPAYPGCCPTTLLFLPRLLARHRAPPQVRQGGGGESDIRSALTRVALGEASMAEAVGPAVGCLMATVGTNMISTCIYDFEDPEDLEDLGVEQRIELWGLQVGRMDCFAGRFRRDRTHSLAFALWLALRRNAL